MALVPAYNEQETIAPILAELAQYADAIVVVDDGSTDDTAAIAREAGASVISHVINRGVGAATRTGYRYAVEARFDYVAQIDADGQHDPRYLPQMIAEAQRGADMVIGSRFLNESHRQHSWLRRVGIRFFTRLGNGLSGLTITDITSGFRIYRTESLTKLSRHQDKHWAVEQTLEAARKGLIIREVSVEMPTRRLGRSQFNLNTFLWYPVRMLDIIFRILVFRR